MSNVPTPAMLAGTRRNLQAKALEQDFLIHIEERTERLWERARWKQGYKTGQKIQNERLIELVESCRAWWEYVTPDMLIEAIRLEHYDWGGNPVKKDDGSHENGLDPDWSDVIL
jgi:hypothetical protein